MYRRLIGKLIYLTLPSPYITYVVNVSQFMHATTNAHVQAIEHILYYLKRNPSKGLLSMRSEGIDIEGYSNVV